MPQVPVSDRRPQAPVVVAAVVVIAVAVGAVGGAGCTAFGQAPAGDRLARLRESPHHNGTVFVNPVATRVGVDGASVDDFFKEPKMTTPICPLPLWPAAASTSTLSAPPASGLRVTWLGHSTSIVEIDGVTVLTDPQFSPLASPVALGPRRFHPPPLPLAALPPIDVVVISHDHYDHLDMASVQGLAAAQPSLRFFVPLGVGSHFDRFGVDAARVVEFDWDDSVDVDGVRVVLTPTRHFSGRSGLDANRTLWGSWAFVGPRHRAWFSGDTGLTPQFQTIGDRYGPFDVVLVEVGQYNRAWGSIHLGPAGALRAAEMLGARRVFPVHWGTFNLGLHDWNEPVDTAVTQGRARGVDVVVPVLGKPIEPETRVDGPLWWREHPPLAAECPPVVEGGP